MMNKTEMINAYAERYETSKVFAKEVVNNMIELMQDAVINDGGFDFYGFMKVEKAVQPARERVNPTTGIKFMSPEKFVPKAKFSSRFKEAVKG